jgi:uncharacterized protein
VTGGRGVTVVDVPHANRYEARVGGDIAGVASYIRSPQVIALIHTEVGEAYEGRGVGSSLARTALEQARVQGLRVLAVCPFIQGWIAKHPEYQDLEYKMTSHVTD